MAKNPELDFDWSSVSDKKGIGAGYTSKDKEALDKIYEATLTQVDEKKVVSGTVVGITDKDVIVNIGFKSDGLIPLIRPA